MLMTLAATVTATLFLIELPNWKRIVVLLSALPIALLSNIIRIVSTGLCYRFINDAATRKFAHDLSGWLMMPLALVLVFAELLLLAWLAGDGESPESRDQIVIPAISDSPADARRSRRGDPAVLFVYPEEEVPRASQRVKRTSSRLMSNELVNNPVWVWGLPLARISLAATTETVDRLVKRRQPSFFITANTHYAMLTRDRAELRAVNSRAAFLVADGAPLVWASRRLGVAVPERVAGSDLIDSMSTLAARNGYRIFFAGGAPRWPRRRRKRLSDRYPGFVVAGTASPAFAIFHPPSTTG